MSLIAWSIREVLEDIGDTCPFAKQRSFSEQTSLLLQTENKTFTGLNGGLVMVNTSTWCRQPIAAKLHVNYHRCKYWNRTWCPLVNILERNMGFCLWSYIFLQMLLQNNTLTRHPTLGGRATTRCHSRHRYDHTRQDMNKYEHKHNGAA